MNCSTLLSFHHRKKIPVSNRICAYIFIVFCLFPYIKILPLHLDSQPNALIAAAVVIYVWGQWRMIKSIGWILFVMLISFALMLISNPNGLGLRIFTNYLSLFFISYASFLCLKYLKGLPISIFKWTVYVWFFVGTVQFFFLPTFLAFLTLRGADGSMVYGRGVSALAAEPTFYGMLSILLMIICYINYRESYVYKRLILLLIVQLFYSKSATCFMALSMAFGLYFLYKLLNSRHRLKLIIIGVIVVLIINYLLKEYVASTETRIGGVIKMLYYNPDIFLQMDFSVNNRFVLAFMPIMGFFESFGFPHGLGRFNEYLMELVKTGRGDFIIYDVSKEYKTTTALGGPLFELGVFSLPIYYVIIDSCRYIQKNGKNMVLCGLILLSLMLNTMNFNQAILPFLIGNLIYKKIYEQSDSVYNNTCV